MCIHVQRRESNDKVSPIYTRSVCCERCVRTFVCVYVCVRRTVCVGTGHRLWYLANGARPNVVPQVKAILKVRRSAVPFCLSRICTVRTEPSHSLIYSHSYPFSYFFFFLFLSSFFSLFFFFFLFYLMTRRNHPLCFVIFSVDIKISK